MNWWALAILAASWTASLLATNPFFRPVFEDEEHPG